MVFNRKDGIVYEVPGVRCPDCGPVTLRPDIWDGDGPTSAKCPGCNDRLYFMVDLRKGQIMAVGEGEVDPYVAPAWPSADPYNLAPGGSITTPIPGLSTPAGASPPSPETDDDYA